MYRELPPPPELRRLVRCFWVHSPPCGEAAQIHRVLPDGCIDLISGLQPESSVVGPMTRHSMVTLKPGVSIVGARFRPGVASSVLGTPAGVLLNAEPPARAVLPRSQRLDLEELAEGGVDERLARLHRLLSAHLAACEPDPLAEAAADALARQPATSVRNLSDALGVSERQLLRRFTAAVGYPPSVFRRVVRLQRLARLPGAARRSASLVQLAADAGYADQAHMNRDVRDLAGLTPRQLLAA